MNVQEELLHTIGVGCGSIVVDKMLKFYVKVFKGMGKALSGELSGMQTGLVIPFFYVIYWPGFKQFG